MTTGIIQLQESFKALRLRWEETKLIWEDQVQRQFEDEFLAPLETQVRTTHQAMEHLAQLINAALQDCQ